MLQVPSNIINTQLPSTSQAINNNNMFNPGYSLLPENWDNLKTDQKITYTMSTILKNQLQSNKTSLRQQKQINSNTHVIHQLRQKQSHILSKTEIIVSGLRLKHKLCSKAALLERTFE